MEVSKDAYDSLKAGASTGYAGFLLSMLARYNGPARDRPTHPGDGFGRVLAWMWSRDREEAMLFLAGYLADLREHHPLSDTVSPKVSLSELLTGLWLAWPPDVPESVYDALVSYAKSHVASYYGRPV